VTAHAVLRSGESLVLAMEHIVGDNLHKIVSERGPLPVANACYYVHQVALGLQHAFDKGMVHRDIKPDNLMLARDGKKHTVKILDFGLAKATREKEQKQHNLTGDGKMMGTPDYIAPEQILDAAKADIRADIYSLGCTLYFLLTGSTPFQGGSLYEKLQAHMSRTPTSVHELRNEVPPELAQVVARMMAKDVKDRYQKPAEVAQALIPFAKGIKALPASDGMAYPTGKPSTLTGKSTHEGFTLVPTETPRKTIEVAPKKTIVESNAPKLAQAKATPSVQPAGKTKLFLLIGIGLAGVSGVTLLTCVAGLWYAGIFSGKGAEPRVANQDAKPQPAGDPDSKPQPAGNQDPRPQPVASPDPMPPVEKVDNPPPPLEGAGFVPLFDGKTLTGWKTHPSQPGNWRVFNGVLTVAGPVSHLYTTRGDYKDFHLLVESRSGGFNGVYFRGSFAPVHPPKKSMYPSGYNAKIDLNRLGGLIIEDGSKGVLIRQQAPFVPVGQPVTLEVIAEGTTSRSK